MQIFIPSRGRAHLARTHELIPGVTYVVPKDEVKAYYARLNVLTLPCPAEGIGPTRQWIVDYHRKKFGGPLLMLDDDLKFFERQRNSPDKFTMADAASVKRMLSAVEAKAKLFAHGGIAPREGGNRRTEPFVHNTRNLRALWYDADVLHKYKVRFDRLPVMEDFDVALQLLRLGLASCTVNNWVHNQPASNTEGGCSTYRTLEVQAEGARGLARLHPDFVTVVEKPPLISGGWGGQARLDVRVAWKKAYKSA